MLILGFDASTPRCPIVVGHIDDSGAQLLASDDEVDAPNQASVRLIARIRGVMQDAGLETSQLGAVGCGRGPGTFTGIRVTLATAKGISVGLGVDVIAVSSLGALALSTGTQGLVLPLLDARRGEVYGVLTDCVGGTESPRLEDVTAERAAPVEAIVEEAYAHANGREVIAVGSGALAHPARLPAQWLRTDDDLRSPTPAGLFAAIVAAYRDGAAVDPARADAAYLRKSYAELGINKPKRPFVKSPFV